MFTAGIHETKTKCSNMMLMSDYCLFNFINMNLTKDHKGKGSGLMFRVLCLPLPLWTKNDLET